MKYDEEELKNYIIDKEEYTFSASEDEKEGDEEKDEEKDEEEEKNEKVRVEEKVMVKIEEKVMVEMEDLKKEMKAELGKLRTEIMSEFREYFSSQASFQSFVKLQFQQLGEKVEANKVRDQVKVDQVKVEEIKEKEEKVVKEEKDEKVVKKKLVKEEKKEKKVVKKEDAALEEEKVVKVKKDEATLEEKKVVKVKKEEAALEENVVETVVKKKEKRKHSEEEQDVMNIDPPPKDFKRTKRVPKRLIEEYSNLSNIVTEPIKVVNLLKGYDDMALYIKFHDWMSSTKPTPPLIPVNTTKADKRFFVILEGKSEEPKGK